MCFGEVHEPCECVKLTCQIIHNGVPSSLGELSSCHAPSAAGSPHVRVFEFC